MTTTGPTPTQSSNCQSDPELSAGLAAPLCVAKNRVADAAAQHHRKADEITLLVVTKGHGSDKIRALHQLGCRAFGENYAQELAAKAEELRDLWADVPPGVVPITWHYIGKIQSNKIDRIVQYADVVQTVADLKHAHLLAKAAEKWGKSPLRVFIEVNCGEEQKGGVAPQAVRAFADSIQKNPGLRLLGIMAIPPPEYTDATFSSELPEPYRVLKDLAPQIGEGQLSLGMSADLAMGIAAGSTCVRIGRAIVGARIAKPTAQNV